MWNDVMNRFKAILSTMLLLFFGNLALAQGAELLGKHVQDKCIGEGIYRPFNNGTEVFTVFCILG